MSDIERTNENDPFYEHIGYSLHAGQVIVADGTAAAARRLERVLTVDPGMGVARHVDAGYPRAIEVARQRGIKVPMMGDD